MTGGGRRRRLDEAGSVRDLSIGLRGGEDGTSRGLSDRVSRELTVLDIVRVTVACSGNDGCWS